MTVTAEGIIVEPHYSGCLNQSFCRPFDRIETIHMLHQAQFDRLPTEASDRLGRQSGSLADHGR